MSVSNLKQTIAATAVLASSATMATASTFDQSVDTLQNFLDTEGFFSQTVSFSERFGHANLFEYPNGFSQQTIVEHFFTTTTKSSILPSQQELLELAEQRAGLINDNFDVQYNANTGVGTVDFNTGLESQIAVRSQHVSNNVFMTETEGFGTTGTIHIALDTQQFEFTQVETDPRGQFQIGDSVRADQLRISENANVKILTAADTLGTDAPVAQEAHFAIGFAPQGDEEVTLTIFDQETGAEIERIDMSEFIDTNADDHLVLVIRDDAQQPVLQTVMNHLLAGNNFQIQANSQLGREVTTHMFNAGDTLQADLNLANQRIQRSGGQYTYGLTQDVQHTITYNSNAEPLTGDYLATCEFIQVPEGYDAENVTYWPAHTLATSGIMPRSPDQAVVVTPNNDPSLVLAAGVIGYVGASQSFDGQGISASLHSTYSNHGNSGFYMQDNTPVGGCTGTHVNDYTPIVSIPNTIVTTQTTGSTTTTLTTFDFGTPSTFTTGIYTPGTLTPGTGITASPIPIGYIEQHIVNGAAAVDRLTGGYTNFEKPVHAVLDSKFINLDGTFTLLATGLAAFGMLRGAGNRRRETHVPELNQS